MRVSLTHGHSARHVAKIVFHYDFCIARLYGVALVTSWAAASAWSKRFKIGGDVAAAGQAGRAHIAHQHACRVIALLMAGCVCWWKHHHSRTLSDEQVPAAAGDEEEVDGEEFQARIPLHVVLNTDNGTYHWPVCLLLLP